MLTVSKVTFLFLSYRVENKIGKAVSRQLSTEKSTHIYDRNSTNKDEVAEPTHVLFPTKRREWRETILEEKSSTVENDSNVEHKSSSRVRDFTVNTFKLTLK